MLRRITRTLLATLLALAAFTCFVLVGVDGIRLTGLQALALMAATFACAALALKIDGAGTYAGEGPRGDEGTA